MHRHDIAGQLATFAAWWPTQRPQFEVQARARAETFEAMRRQLDALAR